MQSVRRDATQATADPWNTKVALDANCISNGLEHRVAFALYTDNAAVTRRYVVLLNHGAQDKSWWYISPSEAPGEAPPLTGWTNGQQGSYARVFGWAPRPDEQMWHRYAVGYQVLLQSGDWSEMYVVSAFHSQDGSATSDGGCTTGR